MNNKLKTLLEKIITKASETNGSEPFQSYKWMSYPEYQKIIQNLEATNEGKMFDDQLQSLGNDGRVVSVRDLATWLVIRSSEVSAEQAISELYNYCKSKEVEVYAVMLLSGLHIQDDDCDGFEFCNGVKLIKGTSAPNRNFAQQIWNGQMGSDGFSFQRIDGVLIAPYKQEIVHESTIVDEKKAKPPRGINENIPVRELKDAQLCMVLARSIKYGIQTIANGTITPDHLPFIGSISGWSVHNTSKPAPLSPEIIRIQLNQANNILGTFKDLDSDFKEQLTLSIDRLNGFGSGAGWVDKFIDLRVCLESIFLSDDVKTETTRTLSLRAAKFLGNDLNEREHIRKIVADAYAATSTAIHTGKLATKTKRDREKNEATDGAAKYAKQAILKLVEHGPVDKWEAIELS